MQISPCPRSAPAAGGGEKGGADAATTTPAAPRSLSTLSAFMASQHALLSAYNDRLPIRTCSPLTACLSGTETVTDVLDLGHSYSVPLSPAASPSPSLAACSVLRHVSLYSVSTPRAQLPLSHTALDPILGLLTLATELPTAPSCCFPCRAQDGTRHWDFRLPVLPRLPRSASLSLFC